MIFLMDIILSISFYGEITQIERKFNQQQDKEL